MYIAKHLLKSQWHESQPIEYSWSCCCEAKLRLSSLVLWIAGTQCSWRNERGSIIAKPTKMYQSNGDILLLFASATQTFFWCRLAKSFIEIFRHRWTLGRTKGWQAYIVYVSRSLVNVIWITWNMTRINRIHAHTGHIGRDMHKRLYMMRM